MTADSASRLATAIDLHQGGDLAAAESLYRAVLDQDPANFTATYLLGVLCNQRSDFQSASELLALALRLNPRSALAHLNLGIALWNLDRREEALNHYQYSLIFKPDHSDSLRNCALALQALRRPEESLARWEQLLILAPMDSSALLNRGLLLQDLHRQTEALASFDRALALDGSLVDSLLTRSRDLRDAARDADALATVEKALERQPDCLQALLVCAGLLVQLDRAEEALRVYAQALTHHPDSADVFLDQGNALMGLRRFQQALACYEQVLALVPEHADGLMNRGAALLSLQRPFEALACFERNLLLRPEKAESHLNLGNVLLNLGRPLEALARYDRALALNPESPPALLNQAHALLALKRPAEARASCERALVLQPDCVDALVNLGTALLDLKHPAEALGRYERALALKPDYPDLLMNRGTALHLLGRHRDAIASYDQTLVLQPDHARAHSNKIYLLDFLPEVGFLEHQVERQAYNIAHARHLENSPAFTHLDRNPERRLVLGYVSADFKHHSAASCFLPVLQRHCRGRFRVNCYSGVLVEDDWTHRFRRCADTWTSVAGMSDDALAARIREDGVDILIDLSGHSKGNRLLVFARKPAPIQVTAWGHGGGTGLPTVDYQFADPVSIPAAVRPFFAEKVVDLPCCITFEAPGFAPAIAERPARGSAGLTFGCLNRYTKVTPAVEQLWARILLAVPGSRLLLKDALFDDPGGRETVLTAFARLGIRPERIELRGFTSHREHLASYGEVDIVLDTFPQNGGITTWEALWMGAPVIAMLGNKFVSRVSGAILHALDLAEWVGQDPGQYLEIAVRMAADPAALARFRVAIRARILASAAGNPEKYTLAVEDAYRAMWGQWLGR